MLIDARARERVFERDVHRCVRIKGHLVDYVYKRGDDATLLRCAADRIRMDASHGNFVVTLASVSRGVSAVFGPMTREEAEALNAAIYKYGEQVHVAVGGIYRPSPGLRLTERFFLGGLCVYDGEHRDALAQYKEGTDA